MTWVSPPTFTDGAVLTGAQLNLLRDDLNETAPAKFNAAGQLFVSTGANAGAARTPTGATPILTNQSSTSASYTNLTTIGPQVASLTTGTQALVLFGAQMTNNTSGQNCFMSVAVSGATTIGADDAWSLRYQSFGANSRHRGTAYHWFTTLTPGSNTFTAQYRVDAGSGSWLDRSLIVIPL